MVRLDYHKILANITLESGPQIDFLEGDSFAIDWEVTSFTSSIYQLINRNQLLEGSGHCICANYVLAAW